MRRHWQPMTEHSIKEITDDRQLDLMYLLSKGHDIYLSSRQLGNPAIMPARLRNGISGSRSTQLSIHHEQLLRVEKPGKGQVALYKRRLHARDLGEYAIYEDWDFPTWEEITKLPIESNPIAYLLNPLKRLYRRFKEWKSE